MRTFLVGGARSGKSTLAVEIGLRHDGPVVFVATAEAFDDDLAQRIARHRDERPDWPTAEVPVALAEAITACDPDALVIVDCLTVWVGNLFHHLRTLSSNRGKGFEGELGDFGIPKPCHKDVERDFML